MDISYVLKIAGKLKISIIKVVIYIQVKIEKSFYR